MADALIVTKAMKASTIAEFFIEDTQIRLELEIATTDLPTFENILPDKLFKALGKNGQPLPERARQFVREDFVLADQTGEPLIGSLIDSAIRPRIIRDEITGEPLAEQPDDAELVLLATLEYTFKEQPKSLTIQPPLKSGTAATNIGFVCYHKGLAVNDFRYLPGPITLDLDWDDPWFSKFRHPNFRRQFDAPLSAYLYVEPFEVRQEIILRPKDLQTWIDLKLPGNGILPIARQEGVKKQITAFLMTKNPVSIDGRPAKGRLDRIHFLRRTLRTTGIIEPPEDLDLNSATLGVIIIYPIEKLPNTVSMNWELFNPRIQVVPSVASDEVGGLPTKLTPDDPMLVWKNSLKNPTNPQLHVVVPPPREPKIAIPVFLLVFGGLFIVFAGIIAWCLSTGRPISRLAWASSLALLIIAAITSPFGKIRLTDPLAKAPQLTSEEAESLLKPLLHNVYISFDHHDDSLIYDRLAQSISGEMLEEVYLRTRKSMEIKNQGGLRISVKNVDITDLQPSKQDGLDATFRCRWRVAGWIGHWGHIHQRMNEHEAMITIAPRDEKWKITAIKMLDEEASQPRAKQVSQLPDSNP